MSSRICSLMALGGLLALGNLAASPVEITIIDNDPRLWGFSGAGSTTAAGRSDRGNFGPYQEDNETEYGTIGGQLWDMEAFVLDGSSLSIVTGFNMLNGVQANNVGAGDLFIKVGGTTPGFNPTNQGAGNVTNSLYNYTYAVDLSMPSRFGNTAFGATAQVFALNGSSVLHTVQYDQFGSNPWKYANTLNSGTGLATNISYTSGYGDGASALSGMGLSLQGGSHNILTVDLSFLGNIAAGTPVYFSYTMECGNDSLKGRYAGGFDRVPDGAASILLIVAGLAGLAVFGLSARRIG